MSGELEHGFTVGEYRIERTLGQGGMGAVYLAVQPLLDKRVAVKVLRAALSDTPGYAQRFLDEARAAVQIGHRNIVDVITFGRLVDGRLYYVMEFLEGCTLAQRLEAHDLATQELRRLLGEICEALSEAHRHQIVHRDLKPDNIWIAQPPRGLSYAKILDFGIAKIVRDAEKLTLTGTQMGTPRYMAPEQWRGRDIDHRADLYSLGVILYQVFAGRLPFEAETTADLMLAHLMNQPLPPSVHRPMSSALERLILDCLAKDPAARPASAAEAALRLDQALAAGGDSASGRPAVAPTLAKAGTRSSISMPPASAVPVVGSRRPLVLGLMMVTVAVTGAVWFVVGRPPSQVAAPAPAAPRTPTAAGQGSRDAGRPHAAAVTGPHAAATLAPAPVSVRPSPPRRKKTIVTSPSATRLAPPAEGAAAVPAPQPPAAGKLAPADEAGLVEKVHREAAP